MKAIILGAGPGFVSPSDDRSHPTAIHEVATGRRTLDYALDAFRSCGIEEVVFVGGYRIEQIIKLYPSLHYFYNARWEETGPVASLRQALPVLSGDVVISYADVLFDAPTVRRLIESDGVVAVLQDRAWMARYAGRGQLLVDTAEKVAAPGGRVARVGRALPEDALCTGQFAGLARLSADAVQVVRDILLKLEHEPAVAFHEAANAARAGMTDLLQELVERGIPMIGVDVADHWAELDAPQDVAQFVFGTKAETLERLEGRLQLAGVLEQVAFPLKAWMAARERCIARIHERFAGRRLVVRSSALGEDSWASSNAGRYVSFVGVEESDSRGLAERIDRVFASYGDENELHQCLVQPQLTDVALSGVVFTRDPETAAPYCIINYDCTGSTDGITSGSAMSAKTLVIWRSSRAKIGDARLDAVREAVGEIERVVGYDSLDVEFAVTEDNRVYVLQVRPLVANRRLQFFSDEDVAEELRCIGERVKSATGPSGLLPGPKSVLGVMPDWNPAEIVGRTPRPLALSLYQYLITDEVWGVQRAEYGYRDTFPSPLILNIGGQGYVDTRASFNSFIPRDLPDGLAARLAEHYVRRLAEHPELHDKVEFDVAFTCYTFDFDARASRLREAGFPAEDVAALRGALVRLTRSAMTGGYAIKQPLERINELKARRKVADGARDVSGLAARLRRTLEDCRRFGTLPFAHLARSAFVATDLLRSLRRMGVVSADEYGAYLSGIETVAGRFSRDLCAFRSGHLPKPEFLREYGHLRPGTYDILSPRYDERPDLYFGSGGELQSAAVPPRDPCQFPAACRTRIEALLRESGLGVDFAGFESFVRLAIQGRESTKFEFTREISDALRIVGLIGEQLGFTTDDMSYVPIHELLRLGTGSVPCGYRAELRDLIERRRAHYRITRAVKLPHLIAGPEDVECFSIEAGYPNFITDKHVTGPLVSLAASCAGEKLDGRIVHVENADPGYDWVFGRSILGLLTTYGGANSHMAIRAAEFGLPAAIGCGELIASRLRPGAVIELNCRARQIQVAG